MSVGVTFYGVREGYALRPVNEAGEAEIDRLPFDRTMRITVVRERQAKSHNLFWAIAHAVAKAMQAMGREDVDKDWVADQLKLATGHRRAFRLGYRDRLQFGQEWGFAPRSIDWASMDQTQFSEFLDRVTGFVATDLLPHMPTGELRQKIDDLLDPEQRRIYRAVHGGRG